LIIDGSKEAVVTGVGSGQTETEVAGRVGGDIKSRKGKGGNAFGKIESGAGLIKMDFDSGVRNTLTGGNNGGQRLNFG
jgi:hypothetical protein